MTKSAKELQFSQEKHHLASKIVIELRAAEIGV